MVAELLEDVSSEKQVGMKLFQKESTKRYRMTSTSQMYWVGSADREGINVGMEPT